MVKTPVKTFLCPSTPNDDRLFSGVEGGVNFTAAAADYIAPSGVGSNEKNYIQTNFALRITDDKAILTKKVKTPNCLRQVTDGLSNSVMFLECAAKPDVYCQGAKTTGTNIKTGWASHATGFDPKMFEQGKCTGTGPAAINASNDQGVYAFHPAGANAGFGDGSVRFLDEEISPLVFVSILTRANGEVIDLDSR